MLKISNETKFYVACPASFQTGGTEALHTLAYELRNLGINAIMFYLDIKENEDVVGARFKCFQIPYVFEIEDKKENILIVPEIWTSLLKKYSEIQKVFWWLSVDNYLSRNHSSKLIKRIKNFILRKRRLDEMNFKDDKILHLVQSYYALSFVKKHKAKHIAFLADYLRDDFFKREVDLTDKNRKNYILYNPVKGYEITKKIIEAAPDLTFKPLEKMTPEQVRDLCLQSKIYIDFGNHPGKDRFPREAAIQGNIVITGNRGSAAFEEDVPILPQYKFNQKKMDISKVVQLLRDCLENYNKHISNFEFYRSVITHDKEKFISDLKKIIGK